MYTDWLLKMKENEAQTTLEERVVELLAEHKMTVTTAESCTGGLIAATLVNVPGASDLPLFRFPRNLHRFINLW